jgi:hypothetical protein
MKRTALFAFALLLWCTGLRAQWLELHWADPALRWRTIETPNFHIHFAEQNRAQARMAAGAAERIYPTITSILDWRPRRRTHIVLLDSADFANGYASPMPFNYSAIFLSPPDDGELLQNQDWLELVLTHELFHIVHLDKASGTPLNLRNVLGRLLPFFPNVLQPGWLIEGLAVYAESEPQRGHGRMGQGYFEGMMRAEVDRGLRSLRELSARGRGFPLNRDYLYGSYFFAFLRERYGQGVIRRLIDNYSSNMMPFKVDSNAALTTGKPMDQLWLEYQDWLRARFRAPPGEPAQGAELARAFSLSSPVLAPDGARWYVQADGYTRPRLTRNGRVLLEVEPDTRLAAAQSGVLLAEREICGNHNLLYGLQRIDERGQRREVDRCSRHRFAAELGDGRIAAVAFASGEARVVVAGDDQVLYRAHPGESITGLAAKRGRVIITSLRGGVWSLIELGDGSPRVLLADSAVKHSPRVSETGDEVFFIADYDKAYDVWSLRPGASGLARWTRAPYGVREMSEPARGELLLVTLEADGDALRLYRLPASPLEQRAAPRLEPAPQPPIEEATLLGEAAYSPWPSLRPTSWVPLIQIADGAVALGAATLGQDALETHRYVLAPMFEFTQRELLGQAVYLYDGRHGFRIDRTLTVRATERDDSKTKIRAYSVKEDAQWVSLWRSLRLNRRLYWGLGAAIEQEKFHDLDLGTARTQNERVIGLVAGLDSRRTQWYSEGPSQGQELRLFAETSRRLRAAFDGNIVRADWRGHLPLRKTVLAVRWNEAYGTRGAEPFELGGSQSDDLILLLPVLNERNFALRGYTTGDPALIGHRARLLSAEWRVPIADIDRHFMVPPVGINRVALNLFYDLGAAWERGANADYHRGIGAELMTEPRAGYLFGFSARLGVARGLDEGGSTKVYLRAGRAF